jgi:hypothetical protein
MAPKGAVPVRNSDDIGENNTAQVHTRKHESQQRTKSDAMILLYVFNRKARRMGCLTRIVQGWLIGKVIRWFRNRGSQQG